MLLLEFEGKRFLREYGVPTPRGVVVESARDVPGALAEMPGPWMVKAQVLTGGRGKAGGVLPAETVAEVQAAAEKLLGSTLIGHPVQRLLVEERLPVKAEYYAAVTLDGADVLALLGAHGIKGDVAPLLPLPFPGEGPGAARKTRARLAVPPRRQEGWRSGGPVPRGLLGARGLGDRGFGSRTTERASGSPA